ncbi:helix-turn-helix domain-containing protein [Aquimarina addita]
MTELCRSFDISRPTAFKLISRFEKEGFEGLKKYSSAPTNHPNATK